MLVEVSTSASFICETLTFAPFVHFRVTCNGKVVESMHNPHRAWMQLYPLGDPYRNRVSGSEGMFKFGLGYARVLAAIQQLPHAARCDRFCGWKGDPPPVTPLVSLIAHYWRFRLLS